MAHEPIPVTVLSGFLGAGKTTLLKHMLQAEHGLKLAVIENEFSDTPIDGQLLGSAPVEVMTLANGCVCCSIHVELEKALYLLLDKLDSGELAFDRLVIECTGLADPAPVAQSAMCWTASSPWWMRPMPSVICRKVSPRLRSDLPTAFC
jgi:G3E family GTPase